MIRTLKNLLVKLPLDVYSKLKLIALTERIFLPSLVERMIESYYSANYTRNGKKRRSVK